MATTCKLIAKNVLGSDTATVTFSDIPGTYTDLVAIISARSARASAYGDALQLSFNSSTANYSKRTLYVDTNTVGSASASNRIFSDMPAASVTADTFGSVELYVPNYAGSTNKSYSATGTYENNSATYYNISCQAGLWSDTSAITSIAFTTSNSQNFKSGSSFFLYGITKEGQGQSSGESTFGIQATGGDEVFIVNGYKTHIFKSSGTFNVTSPGFVEYLVIGGGGSGGPTSATGLGAGGGGAGGYRSSVPGQSSGGGASSESLNLINSGSYAVIVGAGGSGTSVNTRGGNGSDSKILSITAIGGGGGGGTQADFSGANGGSGGGSYSGVLPPGSGTTNQGYAGGVVSLSGNQGGGGGGGAGSVGETRTTANNGDGSNGGSGVSSTITGTAVTRAGGGAGGGSLTTGNAGTAGSGGGGRDGDVINGAANTGSGGGGATAKLPSYASSKLGGNGGSGIVIIRYPVS